MAQAGQLDGHGRRQGNAFIGGTKEHVELQAGFDQPTCIEFSQAAQFGAVIEQTSVEEVRRQAPGLDLEFPNRSTWDCNGKGHKVLSQGVLRSGVAHDEWCLVFRLVSLNLNGIRSAATKGLVPWAESVSADCMGVQELKVHVDDMPAPLKAFAGLNGHFHHAEKKGYSGVGLYTRHEPSDVIVGLGANDPSGEFDPEGRYVEMRFDKPGRKLSIISCYFPSGSSSDERQQASSASSM